MLAGGADESSRFKNDSGVIPTAIPALAPLTAGQRSCFISGKGASIVYALLTLLCVDGAVQ